MTLVEVATMSLRAAGAAYVVGGVIAGSRASNPLLAARAGRGPAVAIDRDRQSWRVVGALLFIAGGAATFWGREAAIALLGALLVQQGLYIARQTMQAKAVARKTQSQTQKPSTSTLAAFGVTAVLVSAASFLDTLGALN